jgi:hypothetical protein
MFLFFDEFGLIPVLWIRNGLVIGFNADPDPGNLTNADPDSGQISKTNRIFK